MENVIDNNNCVGLKNATIDKQMTNIDKHIKFSKK